MALQVFGISNVECRRGGQSSAITGICIDRPDPVSDKKNTAAGKRLDLDASISSVDDESPF